MAEPSKTTQQRVLEELKEAGISGFRASRLEARRLYQLLHHDEHVMGAIRGRYQGDGAMFVATNKRMLLLNYKPFFNTNEEISYFVLAGVSYNPQGPFAGVVIHTRMGDFSFRYVHKPSAKIFVDYLERKHLEQVPGLNQDGPARKVDHAVITREAAVFLASHNIGVLSSMNPDGGVNGAAVYYVLAPDDTIYLVTKWATTKARNIKRNSEVAFTVYDEQMRTTVQLRGLATIETKPEKKTEILNSIIKPHIYNKQFAWPPITQITAGPYQVLKVNPTDIQFSDFNQ